jgi:hypothetical protein
MAPAVFTWIPGIKPVKQPQIIPKKQAIKRSKILSPTLLKYHKYYS